MEKGDCFQVAGRLQSENPDWLLCHGIVWHPVTGRHWHAWCEYDEVLTPPKDWPQSYQPTFTMPMVVDKANGNDAVLPRDAYYRFGSVDPDEVWRYDRLQACVLMLRNKSWGPWEGPVELP